MLIRVFLFLFLLANACSAVEITSKEAVHNHGPYCAIASIETLANIQGISELKGFISERQRHDIKYGQKLKPYYDWEIREALDKKQIPYIMYDHSSWVRTSLEKYANSRGVAVTIRLTDPKLENPYHMIVITKYDNTGISFYDCNWFYSDGEPIIWDRTLDWFNKYWQGNSIVLLGKKDSL